MLFLAPCSCLNLPEDGRNGLPSHTFVRPPTKLLVAMTPTELGAYDRVGSFAQDHAIRSYLFASRNPVRSFPIRRTCKVPSRNLLPPFRAEHADVLKSYVPRAVGPGVSCRGSLRIGPPRRRHPDFSGGKGPSPLPRADFGSSCRWGLTGGRPAVAWTVVALRGRCRVSSGLLIRVHLLIVLGHLLRIVTRSFIPEGIVVASSETESGRAREHKTDSENR
jgi:hypothetical protein